MTVPPPPRPATGPVPHRLAPHEAPDGTATTRVALAPAQSAVTAVTAPDEECEALRQAEAEPSRGREGA